MWARKVTDNEDNSNKVSIPEQENPFPENIIVNFRGIKNKRSWSMRDFCEKIDLNWIIYPQVNVKIWLF